jgi:hypothetical protein
MKRPGRIWYHLCIIPAAAFFAAVFGCAVMLLWNALLPRIAGLPPVNFLEAAGLLILGRILFGGFVRPGWHQGHKNPFREKWLAMDDEERKEFVGKFHGCHHHKAFAKNSAQPGSDSPPDSSDQKKE